MAFILAVALAATGPNEWKVPGAFVAVWEGAWFIAAVIRGTEKK